MEKIEKAATFNVYDQQGRYYAIDGDEILRAAQCCIYERLKSGETFTSPMAAARYCQVLLAGSEHEVFYALWLNSKHKVIAHGELFRGTIDGAAVYPREVVKVGLAHNAAAVIFAHNHPSGVAEPSDADVRITRRLKDAMALVDIRVLDHLVVGADVVSIAERGVL